MRLSATLACHMRLERFPMDVQVREPITIIYISWCGKNGNGDYYDLLAIQFQVKGNFIPKLGYFWRDILRRVTFKLNLLATIWQIWRLVGPRWPRLNCHVELNCRSLSLEVKLTKNHSETNIGNFRMEKGQLHENLWYRNRSKNLNFMVSHIHSLL